MHGSTLLIFLLAAVVAIAIIAKRFEFPYPIAFVLGGAALALVPGLPSFTITPDDVFLIILPPLLYSGGWGTDVKVFRQNLRPIALLAVGLVITTTVAVAAVAHAIVPAIGWPAAFALGAIVSPPDAVAAGAVFERIPVPRRILAILDGEGLVNDAVALVLYQFAVAAAVTGAFDPTIAAAALVGVGVGGVLVGLAVGWILFQVMRFIAHFELGDALTSNVIFLIAPYAAYLAADDLHVSGVLSAVVAGVFQSQRSERLDPAARLVASSVWELMIFLFNGLAFVAIGLELRSITIDATFLQRTLPLGFLISALVIVVRVAWVFPVSVLSRKLVNRIFGTHEGPVPAKYLFVIGWSGMRGIVSLAGALAIPLTVHGGARFPARDAIVFITFCVIFTTLVLQGTSLIPILKWLRIDDGEDIGEQNVEIRVAALRAGVARLRSLEADFASTTEWEVEGRLVAEYEYRIAHLLGHTHGPDGVGATAVGYDHAMQDQALDAERAEIVRLRDAGEIPDEIFRQIQYDLDLASARLA